MLAGRQLPAVKRILDVGQPKILNQNRGGTPLSQESRSRFPCFWKRGCGPLFSLSQMQMVRSKGNNSETIFSSAGPIDDLWRHNNVQTNSRTFVAYGGVENLRSCCGSSRLQRPAGNEALRG